MRPGSYYANHGSESNVAERGRKAKHRRPLRENPLNVAKRTIAAGIVALALLGIGWRFWPMHGNTSRPSDPAAIRRGAYDFATGSCISCHALAGVSNAAGAVDLTHEGRRRSATWLLHEITHPTSDRPPTPPGQERDLAAYLASLR
jgi:mono/diheme cytochrome c family protein